MLDVVILPYSDTYKDQVGVLIPSIQKEFGVPITYEDQPDLKNISGVYQKGAGNFWVALDGDTVVGTAALIDRGEKTGILRKMFVHSDYRGAAKGVGAKLLDTLLAWAREQGMQHIFLGTNDRLAAAQRFYEKNGFRLVDDAQMPAHVAAVRMPVDNLHYHKELAA